jgi:hypothetical protein
MRRLSRGFEYLPMFNRKAALGRSDLFVSAKTSAPIPARSGLLREALVQASLDPPVRSIEYVGSAVVASRPIELGAIVLERNDGRFLLDVVPARRVRDLEEEGLVLIALGRLDLKTLTLTSAEIRKEPLFTNANAVWRYRMHPVGIAMRLKVLTLLQEEGPLRLGCLLARIHAVRDPAPAVMALACSDLIELDLVSQPLGPATTARSRT